MSDQLRIAIIEDEINNIEMLELFLADYKHPSIVVDKAGTVAEATSIFQKKDFDVAFVDIQLEDGTSFDALDQVTDRGELDSSLIFVTAHGTFEYALKAIQYSCLNFITKPIDFSELSKSLDDIIRKKSDQPVSQVDILLELLKGDQKAPNQIGIIKAKGIIEFLKADEIKFISADDTISSIHLTNMPTIKSVKSLGYYVKLLTGHKDFIQIHKSTLVNMKHISRYDQRARLVHLNDGEELQVARRQNHHLLERLTQ